MISTVTTKTQVAESYKSHVKDMSTRERIMASTMSVDEYFDELTELVREDYANLRKAPITLITRLGQQKSSIGNERGIYHHLK